MCAECVSVCRNRYNVAVLMYYMHIYEPSGGGGEAMEICSEIAPTDIVRNAFSVCVCVCEPHVRTEIKWFVRIGYGYGFGCLAVCWKCEHVGCRCRRQRCREWRLTVTSLPILLNVGQHFTKCNRGEG